MFLKRLTLAAALSARSTSGFLAPRFSAASFFHTTLMAQRKPGVASPQDLETFVKEGKVTVVDARNLE